MAALATTSGPVFIQDQSASGKRDSSAQRQTAQNRLQARNGLRGDRNAAAKARQLRASWPSPGNLQVRKTAWWPSQSCSNPSPRARFPANREFSRELLLEAIGSDILAPKTFTRLISYTPIPCLTEQGIIGVEQGIGFALQGSSKLCWSDAGNMKRISI